MSDFALAFDIYGTLVNPLDMDEHLREFAGDSAPEVSTLWRQKQLEYTFRRGSMRSYADFGTVTTQALAFASKTFGLEISEAQRKKLISEYQNLRAFDDVSTGLRTLKEAGFHIVAFSNGVEETTRDLLSKAGIMGLLEGVVSVDDVGTFKPAPEVYAHLCNSLNLPAGRICLVSSNPFDVIGGKNFGLKAAWIQRDSGKVFDPWNITPDFTVRNLEELSKTLISSRPPLQ